VLILGTSTSFGKGQRPLSLVVIQLAVALPGTPVVSSAVQWAGLPTRMYAFEQKARPVLKHVSPSRFRRTDRRLRFEATPL
jgi:hypothetical protein